MRGTRTVSASLVAASALLAWQMSTARSDELRDHIDPKTVAPDNPALDLIGGEDLKVTKPGSIKDLSTSLLTLYKDGKAVPQIAIEVSPYDLTLGASSTYEHYLQSRLARILHRTTISLATTAGGGSGSDATTIGAVGVRVRIVDGSDWRLNSAAVECALNEIKNLPPPQVPDHPGVKKGSDGDKAAGSGSGGASEGSGTSEAASGNGNGYGHCFTTVKWNAWQFGGGGAISSSFPGGKPKADMDEVMGYLAVALPIGTHLQLTGGAKYLFDSTYPKQHTVAGTVQIEAREPKFGATLYGGFGSRWNKAMPGVDFSQDYLGLVGAEIRFPITDTMSFSLRFSAEIAPDDSSFLSLGGFRWNYEITQPSKD